MAFHQPARQVLARVARPSADDRQGPRLQTSERLTEQPEDSQTWVLFSPATDITTTSYLAETEHSLETPGRSQLSELGTLQTLARSDRHVGPAPTSVLDDEASLEEDGELDSLDSHLPGFRSIPHAPSQSQDDAQEATHVFPAHDGLGSFRLNDPAIGADIQDHLYEFERFNPRRTRKRRESLDRAHQDISLEEVQEHEKRRRIEDWRLESSRCLLEEVQRETRRRRRSQASSARRRTAPVPSVVPESRPSGDQNSDSLTWHDEDAADASASDGFLSRFTKTFIKDILGLDDQMLSILTGETSLDDEHEQDSSTRAAKTSTADEGTPRGVDSWQLQVLDRVSQELGMLVNHLSHHPGAFATYAKMQQTPLPYAGLPVIPETGGSSAENERVAQESSSHLSPEFQPTMGRLPRSGITQAQDEDTQMASTFTKEEWEQDLDIRVVFRYLRSRFTSRGTNQAPPGGLSYLSSGTAQDSAAKAARVRQHHPLISRARPVEKKIFKTTPASPVALRHQSSCASQSTRRSARRSSISSSRHYWEFGASPGAGPLGSWGEV